MVKSFCQNLSQPIDGINPAKRGLGVPLNSSPGKKLSVFVSRMIPEAGIEFLREKGVGVEINRQDRVLSKAELIECCRGKDGLLCQLTDEIDAEFLSLVPGLRGIANMAAGYDNIDLDAATARSIPVTNTPGVLTDATADLAWALLLAVARRIPEAERYLRAGRFKSWGPMLFLGGDLKDKTLGILGAGRIGTAVGKRARAFAMKILYFDPRENPVLEKETGAVKVEFKTLIRQSDFITIHLPLTPATRHIIGRRELKAMKPACYLVNTSRGAVIDEAALVEALRERRIAGAGLDVYENEPRLHPGLLELENAVLLPHIGSATVFTRRRMALTAAENLLAMLKGERPPNCLNPEAIRFQSS